MQHPLKDEFEALALDRGMMVSRVISDTRYESMETERAWQFFLLARGSLEATMVIEPREKKEPSGFLAPRGAACSEAVVPPDYVAEWPRFVHDLYLFLRVSHRWQSIPSHVLEATRAILMHASPTVPRAIGHWGAPFVHATIERASGLHELWLLQRDPRGIMDIVEGPAPWPKEWAASFADAKMREGRTHAPASVNMRDYPNISRVAAELHARDNKGAA